MVERSHTRRPGDSWHSPLSGALGSDLLDEQDAGLQLPDGMHKQLPADEIEVILWLQRQNPSEFSPQGPGIAGGQKPVSLGNSGGPFGHLIRTKPTAQLYHCLNRGL